MDHELLPDRGAILAVADSPYLRYQLRGEATGHRLGDALFVRYAAGDGHSALLVGPPGDARRLIDMVDLAGLDGLHGPPGIELPFAGQTDEWEFRWTHTIQELDPSAPTMVVLDGRRDADEINAVLDLALPASQVRPGQPQVIAWLGVRVAGRIAAVAADVGRSGVGMFGGFAVHPDFQGQGLGSALTTALTRRLIADYGVAALSVYSANTSAIRMYAKHGYIDTVQRCSGRLTVAGVR
ncbi:GNAT family N-acetyltransferase [Longispora fulva]|uniref:Ribosomal protein S18 acetylase RimI-like enzyme n=1 Tax=Longispora fulva TaxID=619741 RepID=A0A8J7KUU3_9ACTN|nr:GNAT family N-acetyltransferase [Longispora fulva]MBG6134447.1 ribosomal protein S18 acetylase RimI-like enzyme [Longispora fulva]